MRDHLARRYFDTAHAILKATIDEDLPELERAIGTLADPCHKTALRPITGKCEPTVQTCRAQGRSLRWWPGRVYFLTLLEPLAGTTGPWPLPPGRPAMPR